MDKFGLFDILNKLQVSEKQSNALQNLVSGFLNSNLIKPNNKTNEKSESPKSSEPPLYLKSDAILKVIKKHDLISKQIDLDNKNNWFFGDVTILGWF